MYYYSTMRLILIYCPSEGGRLSRPRHCSQCAAHAQSCVSQWFSWKHKLLSAARFEPGLSRAAGKHVPLDHCDLLLLSLLACRSFGVVLWELLIHEIPYKDVDSSAIIWGIGSNSLQLPIPDSCPEGLKLLITQCWFVLTFAASVLTFTYQCVVLLAHSEGRLWGFKPPLHLQIFFHELTPHFVSPPLTAPVNNCSPPPH